ncbi:MAG TPA: phospho-sugar mutase [Acidimicrobiales bacterium]
MAPDDLIAAARAWRDEDPDPVTRAEVDRLLGEAATGQPGSPDIVALRERFGARLSFGTAGLRAPMGAGPNRMNRAVVIRTTAGLAAHLVATGHAGEPVIVGFDARHGSATFAADATAVLVGAGFPVQLADRPLPTPVGAFGVRHLGCCAGVQITASHNPPGDNGCKVYLDDGAPVVPPADAAIAARIDAVGPLVTVPRARPGDPPWSAQVVAAGDDVIDAYVAGAAAQVDPGGPRGVRAVYTPLHGVGGPVLHAVFARAGFDSPVTVPDQAAPDPDFPTVAVPNPEEPGALDLALARADAEEADVVLANDPDADRLAVALPDRGRRGWRVLTGDEIGVVLADWLLDRGTGPDRLVVNTIVSSSMLGRLAEARGVVHAEVLTGFKWIARAALDRADLRFVFGYEEALGSCVGTLVRDKDGITAALVFAELVAAERARGRTVGDRLDDLARELGVHATGQRSIPVSGLDGRARAAAAIDRLASSPPATLAGVPVRHVDDLRRGEHLPPTPGVVVRGDGVRLVVRPSGTEPKLKLYAEAVVEVGLAERALAAARRAGRRTVAAVLDEATRLAGPGGGAGDEAFPPGRGRAG